MDSSNTPVHCGIQNSRWRCSGEPKFKNFSHRVTVSMAHRVDRENSSLGFVSTQNEEFVSSPFIAYVFIAAIEK